MKPSQEEFEIFQQIHQKFQINLAEVIAQFSNVTTRIADSTITRDHDPFEIVYTNGDLIYVLATPRGSISYKGKVDNFPGSWIPMQLLIGDEPENISGNKAKYKCVFIVDRNPEIKRIYSIPENKFHGTLTKETKSGSLETRTKRSLYLPNEELVWVETTHIQTKTKKPFKLEFYWKDPETNDEFTLTSDTLDAEKSQKGEFSLNDKRLCQPYDPHHGTIEAIAYKNGALLTASSESERETFLNNVIDTCHKINKIRIRGIGF